MVGAIIGAKIAARKKIQGSSAPATMVTFEDEEAREEIIVLEAPDEGFDWGGACFPRYSTWLEPRPRSSGNTTASLDRDAKPRIDGRIEQVDDEIDDHEEQRNE